MDATVIVGLLTVVVGIAAVIVQREAAKRQALGLDQWLRDLRVWASEPIDVLSEAFYLWDKTNGIPTSDASRLSHRLSALIDRGRFFLPNVENSVDNTQAKEDEPAAYQVLRHTALDSLVAAVLVIDQTHPDGRKVLWELRREFVSTIYLILDPAQHNRRIAARSGMEDKRVKALLPNLPGGEEAMLAHVEKRIKRGQSTCPP